MWTLNFYCDLIIRTSQRKRNRLAFRLNLDCENEPSQPAVIINWNYLTLRFPWNILCRTVCVVSI